MPLIGLQEDDTAEEKKICDSEDTSIKTAKTEKQREKRLREKLNRIFKNFGTTTKGVN